MNNGKASLSQSSQRVGSTQDRGPGVGVSKSQGTESSRHPATDTLEQYSQLTGSAGGAEALRLSSSAFDIERSAGTPFLSDHIDPWRAVGGSQ